jgi:competence protein ComEC
VPLITWAVTAYAAGLALGFAAAHTAVALGVVACLAAHARWRWLAALPAALLLAAGDGVASVHQWRVASCRGPLAAAPVLTVQLMADAAPGGVARAQSVGPCRLRVDVSVAEGRAPAGARVAVRGVVIDVGRGLLVRKARLTLIHAPGPLPRLRARAARTITRDFGPDAPLAKALLIAEDDELTPALRDAFARSGLVHILSISGLHVTIVAGAVVLLLEALRLSRRAALVGGVLLTAGYVLLIGAPAPAVRAAVMFGAMAAAKLLQRPTTPWAALALGAGWPLALDPALVLGIGWQLTVAGMAGLIVAGDLQRRVVRPRVTGWRRWLAGELTTSVIASLVTAPLVAWYFGRASLIAPLANLAAGPVANLLQPTLFLAMALGWWPAAAGWAADAARPGLRLLALIAEGAAAVPGADVAAVPTRSGALLTLLAVAALLAALQARRPMRWTLAALGALAAVAWWPLAPRPSGEFELHAIDVGQGDALALRTPRGRWILVDAGGAWRGGDAGRRTVVPYVKARGGEVALFVLSHPHDDHVGGAPAVIDALRPRAWWDAAYVHPSGPYADALAAARRRGTRWRRVTPGDTATIDGVHLRVLAPDSAWTLAQRDPNAASVVLRVTYGAHRFLLTGDAEAVEERWLLAREPADSLRADVLKAGHHGSRTSSTPPFLDAVRPTLALVSAGAGNRFGHPHPLVLAAYAARGTLTLRTDQLGSVVIASDGRRLRVAGRDGRWAELAPPADAPPPGASPSGARRP